MVPSTVLVWLGWVSVLVLGSTGCGSSKGLPAGDAGALGGSGGTGGTVGGTGGGTGGAMAGAGGTDAAAGGMGGGGAGGAGGNSPDGGIDASAPCDGPCGTGRACCGGRCVNTANDPFNCGQCGVKCAGATPYCAGSCQAPPCQATTCSSGQCCGMQCCGAGQICCQEQGPVSRLPVCFTPTAAEPTCPQGCAPLCRSDRDQKKNITPVDPDAVLERLRQLPVATWSYREEPDGVRHMGPMAQDFKAAFGLGDGDRYYHSVDAHGVALAAIQALERMAAEQHRRIEALEAKNRKLERKLRELERARE
jgi:Chaperone of endosialidase